MKRDWLAILDRTIDRAEPLWLVVALALTGAIYVLLLLGIF